MCKLYRRPSGLLPLKGSRLGLSLGLTLAMSLVALLVSSQAFAMGAFLEQWNIRYGQETSLGTSDQRCQICHVSPMGGSTNGWNSYGWKVFGLLSNPNHLGDLDYAFDFAGIVDSDLDPSAATNLTEIQAGYFPGWSAGNVNNHFFGSPVGDSSIVHNQAPPANVPTALLDPPTKISTPLGQQMSGASRQVQRVTRLRNLAWPRRLVLEAGQPEAIFIVSLDGKIFRFDSRHQKSELFVDLAVELGEALLVSAGSSAVRCVEAGEEGLECHEDGIFNNDELGLFNMVFAPDFATSKRFYTFHTEPLGALTPDFSTMPGGTTAHHNNVLTEWQVISQLGQSVSTLSSRTLLRVAQPQINNNGGGLQFDSSGALLVGLGDGGADGDHDQSVDFQGMVTVLVNGHGQGNASDLSNPHGAVLRIDPLGTSSANGQYGIPNDNPFVLSVENLSEVFAYGFRNPSQISVDALGELLVVDPGEVAIDEVNSLSSGQFYGWNQNEGDYQYVQNGLDRGYLSDQDPLAENGQRAALALDRTQGRGIVLEANASHATPFLDSPFDWLMGVQDSTDSLNDIRLVGVELGASPEQHQITAIELTKDFTPLEVLHSIKVLPNGRVFVAANQGRSLESLSGVLYELVEPDDSLCFPVVRASVGSLAIVCL